jgi:hypothetical protein
MPTISQFFGITIHMYFDDHPPPHFHAYYGNDAAKIDIDTLIVSEGKLRRRPLALVLGMGGGTSSGVEGELAACRSPPTAQSD